MKVLVPLLSLPLGLTLFCSCDTVGTDVYLHRPNILSEIRNVAIAPVSMSEVDKFRTKKSIMPTELLIKELRKQNLFTVVSSDSIARYLQDIKGTGLDEAFFLNLAKKAKVDAVLFSELKYFTKQGVANAKVHIKIVEVDTGKSVIESKHDTFWGNSYLANPTLEEVTRDALEGALKGIAQKLTQ